VSHEATRWCPACLQFRTPEGPCDCPEAWGRPRPPARLVSEVLDLETVDEDGPTDDPGWLGEEELPF
jgi:hypothetical protein